MVANKTVGNVSGDIAGELQLLFVRPYGQWADCVIDYVPQVELGRV